MSREKRVASARVRERMAVTGAGSAPQIKRGANAEWTRVFGHGPY